MRSPEQIDEMIEVLRTAWRASPGLRLAQLVVWNCQPCQDTFYVEDEKLMKGLKDHIKVWNKKKPK